MSVDSMKLSDTVDGMLSDDYREQFAAEYFQLVIRIENLKSLLDRLDADARFVSKTPRSVLMYQYRAMTDYRNYLEDRASFEGIDFPERRG